MCICFIYCCLKSSGMKMDSELLPAGFPHHPIPLFPLPVVAYNLWDSWLGRDRKKGAEGKTLAHPGLRRRVEVGRGTSQIKRGRSDFSIWGRKEEKENGDAVVDSGCGTGSSSRRRSVSCWYWRARTRNNYSKHWVPPSDLAFSVLTWLENLNYTVAVGGGGGKCWNF